MKNTKIIAAFPACGKTYYFDITWYDIQKDSSYQDALHIWQGDANEFGKTHKQLSTEITYW